MARSLWKLGKQKIFGCKFRSEFKENGTKLCRFLKENAVNEEVETKVRKLNEIAKKRGQTLAQMSLAWIFLCTIHRQNIIRIKKSGRFVPKIKLLEVKD